MPTQRRCCYVLAMLVTLLVARPATALTIRTLDITHHHGSYRVEFDVLIAVAPSRARAVLGDYRQWPRLDDTLTESKLLQTFADGRQRVRVIFHSCVLIFCKDVNQTKDLQNRDDGKILTVMVPGVGDFRHGWERWQIDASAGMTRLQYHAEFAPAFTIPPVIFKSRLRSKLIVTAQRLETLPAVETGEAASTN